MKRIWSWLAAIFKRRNRAVGMIARHIAETTAGSYYR